MAIEEITTYYIYNNIITDHHHRVLSIAKTIVLIFSTTNNRLMDLINEIKSQNIYRKITNLINQLGLIIVKK